MINMEERIAAWEDEGGSTPRGPIEGGMTGTVNQIAWAEQIKIEVEREFDRVREALASVATKQSSADRTATLAIIGILEDKRADVMRHREAGYFIHDWQDSRDQVRRMILEDPRYKAMRQSEP
jgi:hypothetical protein